MDDIAHAYIQEIPQVANGKWNLYPNPWTSNEDIGCSSRVGCDLHSDWCKLRLGVKAQVVTFSLQVTSLTSIFVFRCLGLGEISGLWMLVSMQLVVCNSF